MGRVRSLRVLRSRPICGTGYPAVTLHGQSRRHVHALVAAAFLGPRPMGMQVNHKDGNRANSLLDNLEYVTPSENARDALRRAERPLPSTQMDAVAQMYFEDGMNVADIMRTLQLSRKKVRTVLTSWRSACRPAQWKGRREQKLDANSVDAIHCLYSTGKYTIVALAKTFGVDASAVSRLVRGKIWRVGSRKYEESKRKLERSGARKTYHDPERAVLGQEAQCNT